MNKSYLLLIAFIMITNSYSQEIYFLAGSNITKYKFKSSDATMITELQNGTGPNYEIGANYPLSNYNENFSCSTGITLNEFNAIAGSYGSNYQWNTKYVGAQSALKYMFSISNDFQVGLKSGVNLSSIFYGKQNINGVIYDLTKQKEFSGILFSYFTGIHANYKFSVSSYNAYYLGYLSISYGFLNSINTSNNTDEKLSFNTQQIQFGIHFNIYQ